MVWWLCHRPSPTLRWLWHAGNERRDRRNATRPALSLAGYTPQAIATQGGYEPSVGSETSTSVWRPLPKTTPVNPPYRTPLTVTSRSTICRKLHVCTDTAQLLHPCDTRNTHATTAENPGTLARPAGPCGGRAAGSCPPDQTEQATVADVNNNWLQVLRISLTPCKSGDKETMRRPGSQEFVGQKTWPQAHTWPACCDALLHIFLSAASVYGPAARHLRLYELIVALPKTCNQVLGFVADVLGLG